MNNERFSIPETVFRPDDIGVYIPFQICGIVLREFSAGLDQCGLASTIAASISAIPEEVQGMFWANIGLVGGTTKFPGFRQRLYVSTSLHHNRTCINTDVMGLGCKS